MFTLRWGSATDVGQLRSANEDSHWTSESAFVVADGMGGHAAGEVASQLATEAFSELRGCGPVPIRLLEQTAQLANDRILQTAAKRRDQYGMGTTLVGLFVSLCPDADPNDPEPATGWAVLNIGDSRAYRWADGQLSQVTVDHSEVQELVDSERLTPEQARSYPRRNVVTRSLGSDPAPHPDIWSLPAVAGDRFLLCSDGLTNELSDDEIAKILASFEDPHHTAAELVRQANAAGGKDNTTTIVVDVVSV